MTGGATRARAVGRRPSRRVAIWSSAILIAGLAALNVAVHVGGVDGLWVAPTCAVVLLAAARWLGLSWSELGLGRDRVKAGVIWGGCAIAIVAVIYTVGVLVPISRDAFRDARYHVGAGAALYTAFVRIPLGTVVFEEIAFRGVLWALFARFATWRWVEGLTAVLFGLWHALAAASLGSANAGVGEVVGGSAPLLTVVGTVMFTTIGGLVFGEVRRRSGSLLASVGLHWATNGLGVLFGMWAWILPA